MIPGGELHGHIMTDPVADWSFTDAWDVVQLENAVRATYSINIWAVSTESSLYLASFGGDQIGDDDPRRPGDSCDRLDRGEDLRFHQLP